MFNHIALPSTDTFDSMFAIFHGCQADTQKEQKIYVCMYAHTLTPPFTTSADFGNYLNSIIKQIKNYFKTINSICFHFLIVGT